MPPTETHGMSAAACLRQHARCRDGRHDNGAAFSGGWRETDGVPNGFRRACVWPLSVVGYADLLAA